MSIFSGFNWIDQVAAETDFRHWAGNPKSAQTVQAAASNQHVALQVLNDEEEVQTMTAVLEPLVKPSRAIEQSLMDKKDIAEYRAVADEVGVPAVDLVIEEFRFFLAKHDLPVYNLGEVVKYMDGLTARDNPTKLGWQWHPVRAGDQALAANVWFGRASREDHNMAFGAMQTAQGLGGFGSFSSPHLTPASDYHGGGMKVPLYTRRIPIQALQKIALVEREFGRNKVAFMITDYVAQPHIVIKPDPFLMAVIPNSEIKSGKGRFVIDVWDEPGFGIEQQIK